MGVKKKTVRKNTVGTAKPRRYREVREMTGYEVPLKIVGKPGRYVLSVIAYSPYEAHEKAVYFLKTKVAALPTSPYWSGMAIDTTRRIRATNHIVDVH